MLVLISLISLPNISNLKKNQNTIAFIRLATSYAFKTHFHKFEIFNFFFAHKQILAFFWFCNSSFHRNYCLTKRQYSIPFFLFLNTFSQSFYKFKRTAEFQIFYSSFQQTNRNNFFFSSKNFFSFKWMFFFSSFF